MLREQKEYKTRMIISKKKIMKRNELKMLKTLFKIHELSYETLAAKLKISKGRISMILNGEYSFTTTEIANICQMLEIPANKIPEYFFRPEDQEKLNNPLVPKQQKFRQGTQGGHLSTIIIDDSKGLVVSNKNNVPITFKGQVEYCITNNTYWINNRPFNAGLVEKILYQEDIQRLDEMRADEKIQIAKEMLGMSENFGI